MNVPRILPRILFGAATVLALGLLLVPVARDPGPPFEGPGAADVPFGLALGVLATLLLLATAVWPPAADRVRVAVAGAAIVVLVVGAVVVRQTLAPRVDGATLEWSSAWETFVLVLCAAFAGLGLLVAPRGVERAERAEAD